MSASDDLLEEVLRVERSNLSPEEKTLALKDYLSRHPEIREGYSGTGDPDPWFEHLTPEESQELTTRVKYLGTEILGALLVSGTGMDVDQIYERMPEGSDIDLMRRALLTLLVHDAVVREKDGEASALFSANMATAARWTRAGLTDSTCCRLQALSGPAPLSPTSWVGTRLRRLAWRRRRGR